MSKIQVKAEIVFSIESYDFNGLFNFKKGIELKLSDLPVSIEKMTLKKMKQCSLGAKKCAAEKCEKGKDCL